ncbi:polysaccharide deacetylase family protein [Streptomyces sp. NPDC052051]|uniref:polysaccharide deacetylase family protein n=1 Tax=Streptomyces sp. NPDC052051 TaxID=3154649 RepID=UPI0034367A26
MRLVRQDDEGRAKRVPRLGALSMACAALALLALAALAAACSGGGVPGTLGSQSLKAPQGRALDGYPGKPPSYAQRAAAATRWGLAKVPLVAAPPAKRPAITFRKGFGVPGGAGLPPVFTSVPTKDKVVFLTIDDGTDKDPAFLRMMSELHVPYTAFLSDTVVDDDDDYFRGMRDLGVTLDNRTLHDPYLPGMSYEEQKNEICGMQDVMKEQFGRRPTVFRPPQGAYDKETLRAARDCGIAYVPLWNEEIYPDHWEYREWDRRLHPGDIVLAHFKGSSDWDVTMSDLVRRFLKKVTDDGYAVGRLEDYL